MFRIKSEKNIYNSANLEELTDCNFKIADSIDIDFITSLCENFTEITGFVTALLELDGTVVVATGWRDICTKYHRMNKNSLKKCTQSDTFIGKKLEKGEQYSIYKCKNGLIDAAIPVKISGKHVANFFTGQFFLEGDQGSEEQFRKQAKELGISDVEGYIESYYKVPCFTKEKVEKTLKFLVSIVEMIGNITKSEEELSITLNSIGDAVIATNKKGLISRMNPVAEKLTGWSINEAIDKPLQEVFNIINSKTRDICENPAEKILKYGETIGLANHTILVSKNGHEYQIADSGAPIHDNNGNISGVVLVFRDVSEEYRAQEEKRQLLEKLSQSQKMDAIGQLAGGVAHDFNNMLGGIIGAAQLLKSPKQNLDKKGLQYVDMILNASNRAADLTAKLLAFGRKGKIDSTAINIHDIIDETVSIFNRTINKRIKISVSKSAENSTVIGDNTALQNSLLNLGINASNAMPNGGELKIETRNVVLNEKFCETIPFDIEQGEYIEIDVRDTGSGISPNNLQKIFEPFFTTKKEGEGTGLGLASVYGTILDHHGALNVYSELGVGTIFHLYLPCSDKVVNKKNTEKILLEGTGKILLVDDEELISVTGKYLLEEMGYSVLLAKNGLAAVEIFKNEHSKIDIVVMDMIMAEMNGSEAFYKMKEIDSNCKVVISSGFTKDSNLNELRKAGLAGFIQKPFRDYELSQLLNHILKNR